jgi:protein-tyrosine kinase
MSPAAERIRQRFLKDASATPGNDAGVVPSSASIHEFAGRFDVVQGGKIDSAPAVTAAHARHATPVAPEAPPSPAEPLLAPARRASWSPQPVHRQAAAVEQYRRLAAQLIHASVERGIKVVMMASAVRGEGKSLTAANLAVTLARSYQRNTLLVDADQRAPMQHNIFRVDNTSGLSDWLHACPGAGEATIQLMPSLTLLTAGLPTMDPMAGLTSWRMQALIAEAKASYDFVVIDSPPATLVPDAGVLVTLVDATVLVIRAGSTPHASIAQAVEVLGRERILGTVLNGADETTSAGRYWYGHGRA